MTPEELAAAFEKAGIDTVEEVDYFARLMSLTANRTRKERELSAKRAEIPTILATNTNEQLAIRNEIDAIDVEINALVPPPK